MSKSKHLQHIEELVQEFAKDYEIARTRSGHFAVVMKLGQSKATVFAPGTPSDHRSMKNVRTKLRKAALTLVA
jgi:hypothetical protein